MSRISNNALNFNETFKLNLTKIFYKFKFKFKFL